MKFQNFFKVIALALLLGYGSTIDAQVTTGAPQGTGPSNITRPPLIPPKKPLPPRKPIPAPAPQVELPPITPSFTRPGIITMRGEEWAGSDHLYGLTNAIGIVVDIVKSDKIALPLSEGALNRRIQLAFNKEGIFPTFAHPDNTPLPFFNLLVMVVPAGEGLAAYCAGRVFEKVELDRVYLEKGIYFQAITWEYQNMVFASSAQITPVIESAVDEVVNEFITRYRVFQTLRNQQRNP